MPKRRDGEAGPTWTPNQVVAANLARLRQRRGLTQAEAARQLSAVAGKEWTEAMVAHAERSVTGNRVREFTADDLVTYGPGLRRPGLVLPHAAADRGVRPGPRFADHHADDARGCPRPARQPLRMGSAARRVELRRRRGAPVPSRPGAASELCAPSPERWRWSGPSTSSAATSRATSCSSGRPSAPSPTSSSTSSSTRPWPSSTRTSTSAGSKPCGRHRKGTQDGAGKRGTKRVRTR